jgi:hypothetical protein
MTRKRTVSEPVSPESTSAAGAVPVRATKSPRATHTRRTKAAPTATEPLAATAIAASGPEADYQDIARLAYSYWEARGYQGGSPEEDWLRAEQELRSRN